MIKLNIIFNSSFIINFVKQYKANVNKIIFNFQLYTKINNKI